jgi:hypothetical protein
MTMTEVPLPEPDVTTLCDYYDATGQRNGLAYSVDAVRIYGDARAAAAVAAERERAAQMCDAAENATASAHEATLYRKLAHAIRQEPKP